MNNFKTGIFLVSTLILSLIVAMMALICGDVRRVERLDSNADVELNEDYLIS